MRYSKRPSLRNPFLQCSFGAIPITKFTYATPAPVPQSLYQCLFGAIPNTKYACANQRPHLNYVTKVFIGYIPKTNDYLRQSRRPS